MNVDETEQTLGPLDRRDPTPGKKPSVLRRISDLVGRFALGLGLIFVVYSLYTQTQVNSNSGKVAKQAALVSKQSNQVARQARLLAAQSKALAEAEIRDRAAAVAANVRARHDDCENSNRLRKALRDDVLQSKKTLPVMLALLPSLNTPQVRALVKANNANRIKSYAARDCEAYAREALP